jgi:hypothetical protein
LNIRNRVGSAAGEPSLGKPGMIRLVFLLYQKGRGSRIFQGEDRAIDDFTLKGVCAQHTSYIPEIYACASHRILRSNITYLGRAACDG